MEDKDLNKILIAHLSQMRDCLNKLIQRGEKHERQVKLNDGCLGWLIRIIQCFKDPRAKDPRNPIPSIIRTADLKDIVVIIDNTLSEVSSKK